MNKKIKVIIFGTGTVAEYLYNKINLKKTEIVCFINENDFKEFHKYRVILPNDIHLFEYDYIIIASGYVSEIEDKLLKCGVEKNKIISFIFDDMEFYKSLSDKITEFLAEEYNSNVIGRLIKSDEKISKIYPAAFWDDMNEVNGISKDFVREQTLKLLAKQIHDCRIEGSIAEVGVYKGDFTVIIDREFQSETLYLFDTFSGFMDIDLEQDETIRNKKGEKNKFKDTSEEYVLNRLRNPGRVVIKSGYFPNSFDAYEEIFSFVSIDLNLYNPVYDALEIFYQRLARGGIIMVSDYYAPFYKGTHDAVNDWGMKHGKTVVPVADFYGSVLIIKE